MRTCSSRIACEAIHRQLAAMQMSERDRHRAERALHDAAAIMNAVAWIGEGIASLGARRLAPRFNH